MVTLTSNRYCNQVTERRKKYLEMNLMKISARNCFKWDVEKDGKKTAAIIAKTL